MHRVGQTKTNSFDSSIVDLHGIAFCRRQWVASFQLIELKVVIKVRMSHMIILMYWKLKKQQNTPFSLCATRKTNKEMRNDQNTANKRTNEYKSIFQGKLNQCLYIHIVYTTVQLQKFKFLVHFRRKKNANFFCKTPASIHTAAQLLSMQCNVCVCRFVNVNRPRVAVCVCCMCVWCVP